MLTFKSFHCLNTTYFKKLIWSGEFIYNLIYKVFLKIISADQLPSYSKF